MNATAAASLPALAYRVHYRVGILVRQGRPWWTLEEAERDRQAIQERHPGCWARSVPMRDLTAAEREQLEAVAEEAEDEAEQIAAREASIAARQAMIPPQYLGPNELILVVCPCCGNKFQSASSDRIRCRNCRKVRPVSGGHHKRKESNR
jgi:hypothetical protein